MGAACFAAGWLYTGGPRPYGYYGFGELFVFVFFGLVATVGSAYVQDERVTAVAVLCGCAAGFLATALLIVNNLRDIPTDAATGKKTLAVRVGDGVTRELYVAAMTLPLALLIPLAFLASPWVLLALFAIVPAAIPVTLVRRGAAGLALIPVLGATGRVQLVYGVLLAVGLVLSG